MFKQVTNYMMQIFLFYRRNNTCDQSSLMLGENPHTLSSQQPLRRCKESTIIDEMSTRQSLYEDIQ